MGQREEDLEDHSLIRSATSQTDTESNEVKRGVLLRTSEAEEREHKAY